MNGKTCLTLLWAVAFVAGCAHDPEGDVSSILLLDGDAQNGATFYASTCSQSSCHGADGTSGSAPSLADHVPGYSDEELAQIVRYGLGSMPASTALDDQAVADVVAYLRQQYP